nr:auxin response factor 18 [Tanacetum cinerariifolium]
MPFGATLTQMRSGSTRNMNIDYGGRGKVRLEDVIKATPLAANGKPFKGAYYPHAFTPDFCKVSTLTALVNNEWYARMRFKMAFETSRINWSWELYCLLMLVARLIGLIPHGICTAVPQRSNG